MDLKHSRKILPSQFLRCHNRVSFAWDCGGAHAKKNPCTASPMGNSHMVMDSTYVTMIRKDDDLNSLLLDSYT
jgi:hypothetical protein